MKRVSTNTLKRLNNLEEEKNPRETKKHIKRTADMIDAYMRAETEEEERRVIDEYEEYERIQGI